MLGMHDGSRAAAYANAATSGSGSRAPECRLDSLYACASSKARTRTSPLLRNSE